MYRFITYFKLWYFIVTHCVIYLVSVCVCVCCVTYLDQCICNNKVEFNFKWTNQQNKLIPFTFHFNLRPSSQSIKLSIITNTFAGQSHVLQWGHCRWWDPPPCCLECVAWTGFQSCGSLRPVLRWEAPMNNRHLSHLINRTDKKKKNQQRQIENATCMTCWYTY